MALSKFSILRARICNHLFPIVQSWRTIGTSLLTPALLRSRVTCGNNSFGEQARVLHTLVIYLTQKYVHGDTLVRWNVCLDNRDRNHAEQ